MNYMLTERAANALRKLLRDANAVVQAPHQRPQKTRPDMAGGGGAKKNKFIFEISFGEDSVTVSSGAVQVGGYTRFVEEQEISGLYDEFFLCVVVNLQSGSSAIEQFESEEQIIEAQDDMDLFIVPLYKVSNGAVETDYRPMPFAGTWEVHPS